MATITKWSATFTVQDAIQENNPKLIQLILDTESMNDSERQYWFDMLQSMNGDQVKRLLEILETERQKLDELEQKYQDEVKKLNSNHVIAWDEYSSKKQKEAIKKQEQSDKSQTDAENVLNNW